MSHVEDELRELRAQLRALADKDAVVQATLRYATGIDTRDWDLFGSAFCVDCTVRYHQPGATDIEGRDAIVAFMRAGIEPLTRTQHLVANHVVHLDGDTARCTSYVAAQHVRRDAPGGRTFLVAGRYEDVVRRDGALWRIVRRDAHGSWTSGNPAVVDV